jgi:5'-3' exonuclease
MGIKHFFKWFKARFPGVVSTVKVGESVNKNIDNLMIDMNGIFHTSAQKIYEYGNFKPRQRLLRPSAPISRNRVDKQIEVFKDICQTIDTVLEIVKPKKRLVLCIDGSAPLSKQNQQRQRRFVSDNKCAFDSNSITPGTKFMDYLSKYVDWYIKKQMSQSLVWSGLEVVFSNEKTPGEGEHKLINFIRKCGSGTESYCVYGMDADLIMLSLGTHLEKFWILRDSINDYYFIDIGTTHHELSEVLRWESKNSKAEFLSNSAIDDFILMCFTVGNDFLPHIPGIEILEGGIDFMIDVYKNTCSSYGHLTNKTEGEISFRKVPFMVFLGTVSQYEQGVMETKLEHKELFFPDPLLDSSILKGGKNKVDIEKYRAEYNKIHFGDTPLQDVCHEYLKGVQWVLSYYIYGVPNWKWRYPHHYAPFSYDIADHVKSFKTTQFSKEEPILPFIQLLSVLPPKSASLLPSPLDFILKEGLKEFCPEEVKIDLAGKREQWEGVAILPMINYSVIERLYKEKECEINENDMKRNKFGKSFVYKKGVSQYLAKSFYGDFLCNVQVKIIDL